MYKILRWIGYASTAVGVILILWACIAKLCFHMGCNMHQPINLFGAANSFLLLAIALFIVTKNCCCDKCCDTKDEKKEG